MLIIAEIYPYNIHFYLNLFFLNDYNYLCKKVVVTI